jgi:hypothetical protein
MCDGSDQIADYDAFLAEDLLWQSYQFFEEIGEQKRDALAALQRSTDGPTRSRSHERMKLRIALRDERLRLGRNAILFAALAVEASTNHYGVAMLEKEDAERLDRLRTVDKVSLFPRLAGGEKAFPLVGWLPDYERLHQLFALRNRIVHPKPGKRSIADADREDFTPQKVARCLWTAAEVVSHLDRSAGVQSTRCQSIANLGALMLSAAISWSEPLPLPPGTISLSMYNALSSDTPRRESPALPRGEDGQDVGA